MEAEFRSGSTRALNGGTSDKNTFAPMTAPRHGDYYEMAKTGSLWTLATAAAGVTVGAANVFSSVAPGQPLVGILNPSTSTFDLVILWGKTTWNGGTAAAGGCVWGVLSPSQTTTITSVGGNGAINAYSLATGGSRAKTFVNAALTGNTTIATALYDYLGGPSTGALAANSSQNFLDERKGILIVPPGGFAGIFVAAAGTSPIINASMMWMEEAI